MKVNVVSRKLIKPYKPTPPHLSTYKISLLDELNAPMHVIRIFYYQSPLGDDGNKHIRSLEESLVRVLPLFYPLAGRYNKDKHEVNCNDEGAEFSTAEIDIQLKQLINDVGLKPELANDLLPLGIGEADELTDPMLAVRVNMLECGGMAIGVCASHRVLDSASLGILLKAWSNAATDGGLIITPDFDSPLYFPGENLAPLQFGVSRSRNPSIITSKFMLGEEVISKLREKLLSATADQGMWERPPSRVVVTSALLTQALLRADTAKHGKSRPCSIGQAINVRERTVPPVSKYACGTWVSMSFLEFTPEESSVLGSDLVQIVSAMRKATIQGIKDCPRILSDKEFGRWVMIDSELEAAHNTGGPDKKVITISDWSKFGDYQLDFGFGKPVWVSLAEVPIQDFMILMNTPDNDGIEAWVFMHESDVPFLNQEYDHLLSLLTK